MVDSLKKILLFPVLRENRRNFRMRFDAHQSFVKRWARLFQMLARPRPLRYDGGEEIERAQFRAPEIRARRKEVGEHLPMLVQPCAGAGADAILYGVVGIGVGAPALRKIDDVNPGEQVGPE